MKILCVCKMGNVRSVTAARILKARGHDALAAGLHRNSLDTLEMLSEWADLILNMNDMVGPDKWHKAMHPDLVKKIKKILKEIEL